MLQYSRYHVYITEEAVIAWSPHCHCIGRQPLRCSRPSNPCAHLVIVLVPRHPDALEDVPDLTQEQLVSGETHALLIRPVACVYTILHKLSGQ